MFINNRANHKPIGSQRRKNRHKTKKIMRSALFFVLLVLVALVACADLHIAKPAKSPANSDGTGCASTLLLRLF